MRGKGKYELVEQCLRQLGYFSHQMLFSCAAKEQEELGSIAPDANYSIHARHRVHRQ